MYQMAKDWGKIIMTGLAAITIICACMLPIYGWGVNIVKLTECDFEAPYKAEIIRGIGIPVPMVGAVTGFMSIKDGKK